MPRRIAWIKGALKDFQAFPVAVQEQMTTAVRLAAHGEKADRAKPMHGLGSGVFEIALPYRGNAYRAVYAVQMGEDVWVIHAFQKNRPKALKHRSLKSI